MDEYIKREYAVDAVLDVYYDTPGIDLGGEKFEAAILKIPAADVAPVRHGRWERTADGAALCTACKRKMNPSQYGYAFCGLCGAKMDGGAE